MISARNRATSNWALSKASKYVPGNIMAGLVQDKPGYEGTDGINYFAASPN
jgi:hypothetical protein